SRAGTVRDDAGSLGGYFKKGSAHITFRKPELVDRLNDIIARHYSEMLPSL
ncbi:DUF4942 domain-containing protein, partial [Escherichia coli]|uniref:DUF4942 domain-containing protein n=1 Tax=Escherichia coli TaxID=562 RepID=UPI0011250431